MLGLPLRIYGRWVLIVKLEFYLAVEGGSSAFRYLHYFGFHSLNYFRVVCTKRAQQDGIIWDNIVCGSCLEWGYGEHKVFFRRDHSRLNGVQSGDHWRATADHVFRLVRQWGVTTLTNNLDLDGGGASEHGADNSSNLTFWHSRRIVKSIDLIYIIEAAFFYHRFCATSAFFCWLEKEAHLHPFRDFWAILHQYLGGRQ